MNKAVHYYDNIVERVEINNNLIVKYKGINSQPMVEIGVNIRPIYENYTVVDYKIDKKDREIAVNGLKIVSDQKIERLNYFYKDHFPGIERRYNKELDEQPQRVLVLQLFFERCNELTINIGYGDRFEKRGINKDRIEKYWINNRLIAGFPYFTQLWVRDFAISVEPLIALGYKEIVKTVFRLIEQSIKEYVPTRLDEPELKSEDVAPLLAIALNKYKEMTGSSEFERFRKRILGLKRVRNGITWMDSIKRYNAYEVDWLYKIANGKEVVIKGDEGVNILFALFFGNKIKGKMKGIKRLEDRFTTEYGISTSATDSKEFDMDNYHKGAVWHFLTGMMAIVEARSKRMRKARAYLKMMEKALSENCIYHLPEARKKTYSTGFAQLWSDVFYEYAKLYIGSRSK